MKAKVTATSLNLRQAKDTNSAILTSLKQNDIIEVLEKGAEWSQVKVGDKTGFVMTKYIADAPEGATATAAAPQAKVVSAAKPARTYFYQNEKMQTIPLEPEKKLPLLDAKAPREQRMPRDVWNKYGNLMQALSDEISIEPAAAIAVFCVESGGNGFGPNKKIIIRFENHLFWNLWGQKNPDQFNKLFKFDPAKKWEGHAYRTSETGEWINFHGNQDKEWACLEFARTLDDTAAISSMSMGGPQILGSNFKQIGFSSPQQMLEYFNKDIRYHIIALFDFLTPAMKTALQNKDFAGFAKGYNGPGQAVQYGGWIKGFYDGFPKDLVA